MRDTHACLVVRGPSRAGLHRLRPRRYEDHDIPGQETGLWSSFVIELARGDQESRKGPIGVMPRPVDVGAVALMVETRGKGRMGLGETLRLRRRGHLRCRAEEEYLRPGFRGNEVASPLHPRIRRVYRVFVFRVERYIRTASSTDRPISDTALTKPCLPLSSCEDYTVISRVP